MSEMKNINITDIQWDIDLPNEVTVQIQVDEEREFNLVDYIDKISDALSDEYGYCVFGWRAPEFEKETKKTSEKEENDPFPGISKKRIADILKDYISSDMECAEPEYVREVLESICSEEEMNILGISDMLE